MTVIRRGPLIGIEIELVLLDKALDRVINDPGFIRYICKEYIQERNATLHPEVGKPYFLLWCSDEEYYGRLPARLELKPKHPISLDLLPAFLEEVRRFLRELEEKEGIVPLMKPGKWMGSIHVTIDRNAVRNEALYSALIKAVNAVIIAATGNPMMYAKGSIRPLTFLSLIPGFGVSKNQWVAFFTVPEPVFFKMGLGAVRNEKVRRRLERKLAKMVA